MEKVIRGVEIRLPMRLQKGRQNQSLKIKTKPMSLKEEIEILSVGSVKEWVILEKISLIKEP